MNDDDLDERIRTTLARYGIPAPTTTITNARWQAGRDDWYVKTEGTWFWWSGKTWKACPHGPTLLGEA